MCFGGGIINAEKFNNALVCPLCGAVLFKDGNSLSCKGARRHNFDIAKSGYVNLNTHLPTSGDDKEMARARHTFLRRGYYARLAEAIAEAAGGGELLCDAGCGEGYYTSLAAGGFNAALGVDLSKYALDIAAKSAAKEGCGDKLLYTAASVYSLPLASGSCDAVINVFAPCVEEEYSRVLKKGARLIVAAAGRDHLRGLKSVLYDNVLPNDERRDYPVNMKLEKAFNISYDTEIAGEDIYPLFTMTPYFYRTKRESAEKLLSLSSLKTLLDFEIRIYKNEV